MSRCPACEKQIPSSVDECPHCGIQLVGAQGGRGRWRLQEHAVRFHWVLLLLASQLPGCQSLSARYLSKTEDEGVIVLNEYCEGSLKDADTLMAKHFPDGYTIVSEGETTHDGLKPTRVYASPDDAPLMRAMKTANGIPLEPRRWQAGQPQKVKVVQWEIHYRRKPHLPPPPTITHDDVELTGAAATTD